MKYLGNGKFEDLKSIPTENLITLVRAVYQRKCPAYFRCDTCFPGRFTTPTEDDD